MIEHTMPNPTELNSFGVLVVTSSEHWHLNIELISKNDNSAQCAAITPRTQLS